MSPSSNNAGMELPPPAVEQQLNPAPSAEQAQAPQEFQPARPEQAATPSAGPPPAPPINIPLPMAVPQVASDDSGTTDDSQVSDSKLLKDKDLIEKEWVNKAKEIIARTKEDPYKQSADLTMLKADYMKKQFNKTLKLNK